MRLIVVAMGVLPVLPTSRAQAQTKDSALSIIADEARQPGAWFRVTPRDGARPLVGAIAILNDTAVRVAGKTLLMSQIATVERWQTRSDGIWDGAAIGGALGALAGAMLPSLLPSDNTRQPGRLALGLGGAIWGGLAGAGIDFVVGRADVWRTVWRGD